MPKPSRVRRTKRAPEPENENLVRLKDIAVRVGLEIREERLTREVGYSVRGGLCRVDDREVVLLDKTSDPEVRIEILCSVLAGRDLEGIFIDPDLRFMIGGATPVVEPDSPVDPAPLAQHSPDGSGVETGSESS